MGVRRHLTDAGAVLPAQTPEDIHALIAAAVNAGDVDAFVALHEDAPWSSCLPTVAACAAETRSGPRCDPSSPSPPTAEIELIDKLQSGDLALTFARVTMVGSGIEIAGRGTVVSRRQPDGSWRISLDNPMSPA